MTLPDRGPSRRSTLEFLFEDAETRDASDIHVVPGYPPVFRVHGQLMESGGTVLSPDDARGMIEALWSRRDAGAVARSANAEAKPTAFRETSNPPPPRAEPCPGVGKAILDPGASAPAVRANADPPFPFGRTAKNHDFSLTAEHQGKRCRFRANVFLAGGQWCACLRRIPENIPTFEWMGFPLGLAERLLDHENGLVVITGVTGSGKSTTLAGLIQLLNERGGNRIITVEEPVEYEHRRISSTVVTQREVGRDVDSFYDGLKYGLRQDPDVILLGEIRDRETAQMALSAAETGHLILTTLHTKDAKGAVTRFVDLFPSDAQDDIRVQLSLSLRSVVSQHLLPSVRPGEKQVLALEILHINQPARIAVRFGKIESIESAIQTGRREGMMTLDDHLQELVRNGRITAETARRFAKSGQEVV